jgi:hypothetical protein
MVTLGRNDAIKTLLKKYLPDLEDTVLGGGTICKIDELSPV